MEKLHSKVAREKNKSLSDPLRRRGGEKNIFDELQK